MSRSVIVILEVAPPSVEIGPVPAMVEVNPAEGPGTKVTETVGDPPATAGVAIVMDFASAFLDAKVQVLIPVESEERQVPLVLVTPVSVALNVGTVPIIALFCASLRVIVMRDVPILSATTVPVPDAARVVLADDAPPGMKVTVVVVVKAGVVMVRVFTSALVDTNVNADLPVASVVTAPD